ncbi:General substrate transporter [Metarhizium album ARSEF 1941]|uniref:General substrate transporter n=1 Tax=Metarhizium album (strain ARSEF 1941) TaxID=1081103 RepID=A0A0B2WY58_METAS|nr:General substrate transporter [Metarhizium album ARSEF 1941]KHN98993.1 General substrate transporter [Metarhizium album ARSEF 1941]
MVAASYTLAAAVGSLTVMAVGNVFGRRYCIIIGNVCAIIGPALQASTWSVSQIIVGRVIGVSIRPLSMSSKKCATDSSQGFGLGFISCTVPTYMAEMSINPKQRGPEIAIQCAVLISGIALAYWVAFGFTRMDNQLSWRFPIGLQAIFAIISLLGMLMLPDTPRWYYSTGRDEQGDNVLSRLHALPLNHPKVQAQKEEIQASIRLETQEVTKFDLSLLVWDTSELRVGRRIRIAFLILSLKQMMGINMMVYYSTLIFSQVGLSSFLSQLLAAVMMTIYAFGTYVLPSTIERFGRRTILLTTAIACTVFMLIFVVMIAVPNRTLVTQWTGVAAVILFMCSFGYGWIGIPWLYASEIAPLNYRHVGGAAGAFGEWVFSFVTVFGGGYAIASVGWRIWIWQIFSCALAIAFVYFMCPETSGKTLEEIDIVFATDAVKERAVAALAERTYHESKTQTGAQAYYQDNAA